MDKPPASQRRSYPTCLVPRYSFGYVGPGIYSSANYGTILYVWDTPPNVKVKLKPLFGGYGSYTGIEGPQPTEMEDL